MARKKKFRKKLIWLPIEGGVGLLTLADGGVAAGSLHTAFTEDFFCVSARLTWALEDHTVGEGPLHVGLAHGDYSTTEIDEALDVEVLGPEDRIETERMRRWVRTAGTFNEQATASTLNDGKVIGTKCLFTISDGEALRVFAQNKSGAALTTGSRLNIRGHLLGRWQI